MTPVLSREQIRAYDQHLIEELSVPGLLLMENAGRGAAEALMARAAGRVAIVCGRGNNGGDGFVVARHLAAAGWDVACHVMGPLDKIGGDAAVNLGAWQGLGGAVHLIDHALPAALREADVIVDGLFGTGLSRPIEGRWRDVVEAMNAAEAPVFALDIPSGIDADTGAIHGVAVEARWTATFAHRVSGLVQGPGAIRCGELLVVPLGVPDAATLAAVGHTATVIDDALLRRAMRPRPPDCHKYRAGAVVIAAGRRGATGAAWLAARGAFRAGAGLVTIATWPGAAAALEGRLPEAMISPLDVDRPKESVLDTLRKRTAAGVGPGFGTDEPARRATEALVLEWEGPVVVDADAITCFAGRPEALKDAPGARILTPHTGELARLLGTTSQEVEAHRFAAVREAARATGCTVVLKGHRSVVATGDQLAVCERGDPVLATGGSGDVLTGIATTLVSHAPAHEAACAAVELHARAGEAWRATHGADRGALAGELADALPSCVAALGRGHEG